MLNSSTSLFRSSCICAVCSAVLVFLVLLQPPSVAALKGSADTISGHASDSLRHDMAIARGRVYPALVNIGVVYRYFSDGQVRRNLAGGSGVIISPDGYVVTNFHVAGHATRVTCTLTTGEALDATVIANDALSDLSILKLQPTSGQSRKFPYAVLGNSDKVQTGDFVLAMGNPLMLSSSMTLGIISNTHRVFTDFTGTQIEDQSLESGERTGTLTRWLQTDALILPGNSGGPLVNLKGEVIGINELGGNSVGFAIPSNIVSSVFQQVMRHGTVIRGWIGFAILPVGKMGRTTGALISSVTPDSSASTAGIKPGDILLSMNSAPTDVQFFEQVPLLYQSIAALTPGSRVSLRLLRGGSVLTMSVPVTTMPVYLTPEDEIRDLGITVRTVSPEMALEANLIDKNGVLITGVRTGYPGETAEPPLSEGDVIRTINGKPTPDVASLRKALASATGDQMFVKVRRDDETVVALVKRKPPKPDDSTGSDLPQAWIGINTEVMLPDIAKALGVPGTQGFLVTQVYPWTQASDAGLRTGDIVTSLNGDTLQASALQDADDLKHAVENLSIGDKAVLGILRDKKPLQVSVLLEPTPTSSDQTKTGQDTALDFAVREITLMDRADHHWTKSQQGVFVTSVDMGGWANVAGLRPEDLIVSINGVAIPNVAAFTKLVPQIEKRHPKVIMIFVRRDYLTHFVFIEPDWNHLDTD